MTPPDTVPPATRRRRPLGVVLIAVFLVVDAALALAEHTFNLGTGTRQDIFATQGDRVSALIIGLVILRLVAAAGLWLGWRRGWVLTMLLVGASLVIDLWLYWNGQPLYLRMAMDVVVALYLNQKAVREFFEGKPSKAAPTPADAPAAQP
jgi:hypothetical protein